MEASEKLCRCSNIKRHVVCHDAGKTTQAARQKKMGSEGIEPPTNSV